MSIDHGEGSGASPEAAAVDPPDTAASAPGPRRPSPVPRRKNPKVMTLIEGLVRQGFTPARIVRGVMDAARTREGVPGPLVGEDIPGERQLKRYIADARKALAADLADRDPTQLEAMTLDVARQALSAGKFSAAVTALGHAAKRRAPTKQEKALAKEFADVGPPPLADPLAGVEWAQKMNLIAMRQAATDLTLSPSQRRDEVRRTGRVVAALVPQERLYDAEQRLRGNRERLDDVRRDPQPTAVTNASGNGDPSRPLRVNPPK